MTQFARPIEDTFFPIPSEEEENQDSWRTQNGSQFGLFIELRKVPKEDSTYAESNLMDVPFPSLSDPLVVKLSEVENPNAELDQGLVVSARLAKDNTGKQVDALIELYEDYVDEDNRGVLIGSEIFENISNSFDDYSFTIPAEDRALIEDTSNLFMRISFETP